MNEKAFNPAATKPKEEFVGNTRPPSNPFPGLKVIPKEGLSRWHNLMITNLTIAVGSRLKGHKNEVYINGMRVKLKDNYICYPDVIVVSGEPVFSDGNSELLQNPTVVIEIVSNTTNPTLKSQKLESYLAMDSIKECLFVKADEFRVEHYSKQSPKQWIYKIYNEREDVISMDSVACKVSMSEVYSNINLGSAAISSTAVN
jgi:Uma2 family endonuclease